VQTFIDDKADDYEELDIVYRFGSFPRLVLRDAKGHKETARIDKWKTEQIEEFLAGKLAGAAAS
jgi:hypothetical protein